MTCAGRVGQIAGCLEKRNDGEVVDRAARLGWKPDRLVLAGKSNKLPRSVHYAGTWAVQMLDTSIPNLAVAPMAERHALALYHLIQENCSHLTAHGDYGDLVAAPLASITAELKRPTSNNLRFGIFVGQRLVGSMDLVPVAPPRYGLGYWLGESSTGKGYATAALQALLEFARTKLRATDVFAGVAHGNWRSRAVLERVGFSAVETFEKYQRVHRGLAQLEGDTAASPGLPAGHLPLLAGKSLNSLE